MADVRPPTTDPASAESAEMYAISLAAARRRGRHVGRPAKLAPDQLDYARRRIVEGEGRAQVARSLGVDPSTLRRLLMKSETW